jgi:hypothetical protein
MFKYYKIHVTRLVGGGNAGYQWRWNIFIHPDYQHAKEIIEHEKCHVRQFWKNPLFHHLLIRFTDWYSFKCELEAYTVSCKINKALINHASNAIATGYGINGLTKQKVKKMLRDRLRRG